MHQWGPQGRGEVQRGQQWKRGITYVIVALACYGAVRGHTTHVTALSIAAGLSQYTVLAMLLVAAYRRITRRIRTTRREQMRRREDASDPLGTLRNAAWQAGGGVHLGAARNGHLRFSRGERAVLLLGPPRSGKTSSVIIPTLLSHTGPAIATSTKPDVLRATCLARARAAAVFGCLTPPAAPRDAPGASELRWSPVSGSKTWDGALLIARAMAANIGAGTTDRSHWANRAQALLAPMLHAAAVHDRDMETVVDWVMRHNLDEAGLLLEDQRCSKMAFSSLLGMFHTEDRERSSIFSAAADALRPTRSEHALAAARDPNFDAGEFVRSQDTVYIHAPAEAQAAPHRSSAGCSRRSAAPPTKPTPPVS